MRFLLLAMLLVPGLLIAPGDARANTGAEDPLARFEDYQRIAGFIDLFWDEAGGRLLLRVDSFDEPFLYQTSLARGVGSNDLGLDRGQLGSGRLVTFERSGPKVLLVQANLAYRASGEHPGERRAVEESFARSVIWGFDVLGEQDRAVIVDATDFFLRDADGIARRLADAGEGDYAPDASRSAIYLPRTRGFPDNSEIEATVTFHGQPTGEFLGTVVPDPTLVTVHLHHSFVRLPEEGYEPLPYDPRAGVIGLSYGSAGFLDYAQPVNESLPVAYGRRHRLEKKNPAARVSEAEEPIVYYVDRGAPEPVRSALLDGARWWSDAFESAGYRNAFRVELLPEDADPMDVRYNVIQWVHRSTRGWSYGSSVIDPRTGEILKGHVTLGSQRVRQDYLIAEGLLAPYERSAPSGGARDPMLDMSLARIRQLSAHEVGHTLGIEHNFAASTQDRASVMDYPFPLIRFDDAGELDLSDAYDTGLGEWDERVILYAYQDFPEGVEADAERERIVAETIAEWKYVADSDARSVGSAHPDGNLWDNGADAVAELQHLLRVRKHALGRFSGDAVRHGRPLATLEDVLVPIFLLHRFQIQAVGKLIGGRYFSYALRGDGQEPVRPVAPDRQRDAMQALAATLAPELLRLPEQLERSIPPRPPGHPRSRENFSGETGGTFDPLAPAASAVALTLDVMLEPARAARMNAAHAIDNRQPAFAELLDVLLQASWYGARPSGTDGAIQRRTNSQVLDRLLQLAARPGAADDVRSLSLDAAYQLQDWLSERSGREKDRHWRALYRDAGLRIERMLADPSTVDIERVEPPPGSPIGATGGSL